MKDINYAFMLIKANKLEGAKDVLEELLQSDPANKDILYNLGMCYTEQEEPEKAVKTLSECIRYYPHYSNAYSSRIEEFVQGTQCGLGRSKTEPLIRRYQAAF
jgi:tetratricopeptide (TPR) repeat protein